MKKTSKKLLGIALITTTIIALGLRFNGYKQVMIVIIIILTGLMASLVKTNQISKKH